MQSSTFRAYSWCSPKRTPIPRVYPPPYLKAVKWTILHPHRCKIILWHLKHLPPWPFLVPKVGIRAKRAFIPTITREWWRRPYLNTLSRIPVAIVQIPPRITCQTTTHQIITISHIIKTTMNFWMWLQSGKKIEINPRKPFVSFFFVFDLKWNYIPPHIPSILSKYSWILYTHPDKNPFGSLFLRHRNSWSCGQFFEVLLFMRCS